ncbi:bifunctional diaminohydroxyphosphoribosylaminopyrimidine deaminase/5-amino-6-(5-phosphoribosylamino)uracil reductase RibD [candidate division KSB1 bacterium]
MPTVKVRMGEDIRTVIYIRRCPEVFASGFLFMKKQQYMKKVIKLAKLGLGRVSTNPLVGAVIVSKGEIVGQGYHKEFGGDHAEIAALKDAGNSSHGAELYCNLEPCSHWGKTPPCVERIVKSGIKKVVIGIKDPNPVVNGQGIKTLKQNGIEVITGILEDECRKLNKFYIKYITTGLPYVTVKMAQTLDGKITEKLNERTNITNEASLKIVHRMRTIYDAVLVGKNTLIIDNPLLTPRLVKGRIPIRIVLDTNLESDSSLDIYNSTDKGKVYIATSGKDDSVLKELVSKGVEPLFIKRNPNGVLDLKDLFEKLGKKSITSVLVEGGSELFTNLLNDRLVDDVNLFIAPYLFGSGLNVLAGSTRNGKRVILRDIRQRKAGTDIHISGKPEYIS